VPPVLLPRRSPSSCAEDDKLGLPSILHCDREIGCGSMRRREGLRQAWVRRILEGSRVRDGRTREEDENASLPSLVQCLMQRGSAQLFLPGASPYVENAQLFFYYSEKKCPARKGGSSPRALARGSSLRPHYALNGPGPVRSISCFADERLPTVFSFFFPFFKFENF
jgi:hypothetical protein